MAIKRLKILINHVEECRRKQNVQDVEHIFKRFFCVISEVDVQYSLDDLGIQQWGTIFKSTLNIASALKIDPISKP